MAGELDFACVDVGSVAVGYSCLAQIAAADVELVEASVVGGAGFLILLRGKSAALAAALSAARASAAEAPSWDAETLSPEPAGLFDAMYSLAEQRLEETLVVCEAPSMSALLSAAGALLAGDGVRAIEIKSLRGARAGALGFFTGPRASCGLAAEGARARWKAAGRDGRIECIDDPPPKFRALFHLDGRP